MEKQELECWGTTYIDFHGNFSETEPQKWAVKYCYFETRQDSCSKSKDGIFVVISKKTTRKNISNLASIVNGMRANRSQEKVGINYSVLESLDEKLTGYKRLTKREHELYRKKHD